VEATVILKGNRQAYGPYTLTTHRITVTDDLTIKQLVDSLPTYLSTVVECSAYFSIQNPFLEVRKYEIQYIVTSNGIEWNVSYDRVKVKDFLSTIGLGQPIYMSTGLQLGGGLPDIVSLWPHITFVLDLFSHTKDVAEVLFMLYTAIRNGKSVPAPTIEAPATDKYGEFLSLVFDRKYWNPHDLSHLTGMPLESARKFVQACAYEYQPDKMLYVATEDTDKLKSMLNQIDFSPVVQEQQNRAK